MNKIVWSERFSVGVEELDEQHKKLFQLINRLIEANGKSTDARMLRGILDEMTQYATDHLNREEQLLEEWAYPSREAHAALHHLFRKKTTYFSLLSENGYICMPTDVLAFLRSWLENHVLQEDMQYRAYLEKQGLVETRELERL